MTTTLYHVEIPDPDAPDCTQLLEVFEDLDDACCTAQKVQGFVYAANYEYTDQELVFNYTPNEEPRP